MQKGIDHWSTSPLQVMMRLIIERAIIRRSFCSLFATQDLAIIEAKMTNPLLCEHTTSLLSVLEAQLGI